MANFTLLWAPNTNSNTISQRASYRQKSTGGVFLTGGFTPANDLGLAVSSTVVGILADNVVYEFKVENICTVGGPTINSNGIVESINFSCTPIAWDNNTIDITSITYAHTVPIQPDINKVKIEIWDAAGTALLQTSTETNVVSGFATISATGLTADTNYMYRTIVGAIVNGVQVWSESKSSCNVAIKTNPVPVCMAPTALTVTLS